MYQTEPSGLKITLSEFRGLPNSKKLDCLFENHVKHYAELKGYRFRQWIQWAWISLLSAGGIVLFKLHIK